MKLQALGRRAAMESRKGNYRDTFDSEDDVAQEYITQVLEGYHRHATIRQAVVDMYREIKGRRTPDYRTWVLEGDANPFPTVDHRLFLEKAMTQLSDLQVKVIKLHLMGFTFAEIAEELNFTEAWAHRLWHRAVELMKELA